MHENTACLKCPDCGGPMTPGEKRDNGRCQYCEDTAARKAPARSTRDKCGIRQLREVQKQIPAQQKGA